MARFEIWAEQRALSLTSSSIATTASARAVVNMKFFIE
jgi:hypothetical protein